ncbi:MAG: Fe-S cluster assembly protein SufB, partial [Dehalococcoidia bacterium]
MTTTNNEAGNIVDNYKYGWNDPEFKPVNVVRKGLDRAVVEQISDMKNEPQWMRDFRLKSLQHFEEKPMPEEENFWGGSIADYPLDFQDIYYYVKPM